MINTATLFSFEKSASGEQERIFDNETIKIGKMRFFVHLLAATNFMLFGTTLNCSDTRTVLMEYSISPPRAERQENR